MDPISVGAGDLLRAELIRAAESRARDLSAQVCTSSAAELSASKSRSVVVTANRGFAVSIEWVAASGSRSSPAPRRAASSAEASTMARSAQTGRGGSRVEPNELLHPPMLNRSQNFEDPPVGRRGKYPGEDLWGAPKMADAFPRL